MYRVELQPAIIYDPCLSTLRMPSNASVTVDRKVSLPGCFPNGGHGDHGSSGQTSLMHTYSNSLCTWPYLTELYL